MSQSQTDMVHCSPNHFSKESILFAQEKLFFDELQKENSLSSSERSAKTGSCQTNLMNNRFIKRNYWNHIKWMRIYISNHQMVWRYRNKQKFDHFRCDLKFLIIWEFYFVKNMNIRGGSWTAAISKMKRSMIIVNGWKHSILDVAAALDPPLNIYTNLLFQLTMSNFTHFPEVTGTK